MMRWPLLLAALAVGTSALDGPQEKLALTEVPVASCSLAGIVVFPGTSVLNALYTSFCSAQGLAPLAVPTPVGSVVPNYYSLLDVVMQTACASFTFDPFPFTPLAIASCAEVSWDGTTVNFYSSAADVCVRSQVPVCQLSGAPPPTTGVQTTTLQVC